MGLRARLASLALSLSPLSLEADTETDDSFSLLLLARLRDSAGDVHLVSPAASSSSFAVLLIVSLSSLLSSRSSRLSLPASLPVFCGRKVVHLFVAFLFPLTNSYFQSFIDRSVCAPRASPNDLDGSGRGSRETRVREKSKR